MYGVPVYRFTLGVEVRLSAITVGTVIQLPDNPILRQPHVKIESVETFTSSQLANTPGSLAVVSSNGGTGLIVNLVDDKNQNRIFNQPYLSLNSASNSGVAREFEPFNIVMQKSSIQVVDGTNLTVGQGVYLVFNYSLLSQRRAK